jgi:predicted N-acetyltransferase YhbS
MKGHVRLPDHSPESNLFTKLPFILADFEGDKMAESLPQIFLGEGATVEQRWRALHQNVQAYYQRTAQAGTSSHIGNLGDLTWTSDHFCILSENCLREDHVIDEILKWFRSQRPLQGAIWWYLHPDPPSELDARLFARGICPNWKPHWMWCDLHQLPKSSPENSKFAVRIATAADYLASVEENDVVAEALSTVVPRRVFHLIACRGITRLGSCILNVTSGELGVSTLFDMMVVAKERRQGVGAALAQAACEMARKMGCNYMMLNATDMGEPVYRRVGFQSMGRGHTWFLKASVLAERSPTIQKIEFLEAVGVGDIHALEEMGQNLERGQLQDVTLNGLTPLEIAVHCRQPGSASWLINQGVIPDIISLWDLGWKTRVPALLAEHPELVKRESGDWTATPLHTAIERDDIELVKLLLTVPNDLDAKDAVFHSTPLGWAHHFQREEMVSLLEAHTGTNSQSNHREVLGSVLGKEQRRSDSVYTEAEL